MIDNWVPSAPVRTPGQRETARAISARSDFDRFCGDAFTAGVGDYEGPFNLLWYRTDGLLICSRIGKTGRILRQVTA